MIKRVSVFSRWAPAEGAPDVDLSELGAAIVELAGSRDDQGVLVTQSRSTAVVIHRTPKKTGAPLELLLFALRDPSGLPIQFRPGAPVTSLRLARGAFAGDLSHVCLWPDGWAGQDWHGDSPRLTRLAEFLRKQLDVRMTVSPVYDRNLQDDLADIKGQLRRVVMSNDPEHPSPFSGVFGTLIPAVAGQKVPSFTVNLGMGRFGPRDAYLANDVQDAVYDAIEADLDRFDSFVVHGRSKKTGKMVEVNLLKRRIGSPMELPESQTVAGMPDSARTFKEIRKTFKEKHSLLVSGAGAVSV